MNRAEALKIADRLWAVVNGPKAGTTSPESLALVRRLTARIQDHPELSVNLKLKADEVAFHCRELFDRDTLEDSAYDVDITAALARNAVIKLKLVAEAQLPSARTEKRDEPEPVGAGQPAQLLADPPLWVPLSLGRLRAG